MKPLETIEDLCVHLYRKKFAFSKRDAMEIIPRARLERLVNDGKIRFYEDDSESNAQNKKWKLNAGDVIWYASKKTRD